MEVVPYSAEWLPQVADLARAHARLTLPGLGLADAEVAEGLVRHAYWPFYTPGLSDAQTLLAVEGDSLLAATQAGFVGHGWGYGAAPDDGPEWLYDVHCSILWLFAWPGCGPAAEAAALLAATVVGWARETGLPGLEAFRGGPGFLPFGTQLSSHWPHLWAPLRGAGFRQPRDLLVYSGETDPDALPQSAPPDGRLEYRTRRGRLEAWLDGDPVGAASAMPLTGTSLSRRSARGVDQSDRRRETWAVIRRLFVVDHRRGRGIGTALFAEQLRRLHGAGVRRYLLHIPNDPQEAAAHALYLKFGALADRQQVLRVSF